MKLEEIIAAGESHCVAWFIIRLLGVTFAVLGVVSDAMNITLAIESISWLLVSNQLLVDGKYCIVISKI